MWAKTVFAASNVLRHLRVPRVHLKTMPHSMPRTPETGAAQLAAWQLIQMVSNNKKHHRRLTIT
jgi:hypothetical protein